MSDHGTVQASDVEVGMRLERLTYDEYDRPRYVTAKVEGKSASSVVVGGFAITWSDGTSATYGPTDRFIARPQTVGGPQDGATP